MDSRKLMGIYSNEPLKAAVCYKQREDVSA